MLTAQSQQWSAGFDWSALWLHDLQDNSDMLLTELTWIKPEYDMVLQWQWPRARAAVTMAPSAASCSCCCVITSDKS
ncbi:MAG: hypothetical protein U5L02_20275 [Rheinheimera sp.]|nr:hypothetical protein [Rheinheimera sp.]